MLHEEKQTILDAKKCSRTNTRSTRENIMSACAVLCATDVSSGLETSVNLTQVLQGVLQSLLHGVDLLILFCTVVRNCCGVSF